MIPRPEVGEYLDEGLCPGWSESYHVIWLWSQNPRDSLSWNGFVLSLPLWKYFLNMTALWWLRSYIWILHVLQTLSRQEILCHRNERVVGSGYWVCLGLVWKSRRWYLFSVCVGIKKKNRLKVVNRIWTIPTINFMRLQTTSYDPMFYPSAQQTGTE